MDTLESPGNENAGKIGEELVELGPWFHNLHLPDGVQTAPNHPLGDFPAFKWRQLASGLPKDLAGWRVLDIGCNAGFYSFALAEMGAEVVGVDADPHYLRQARWACEHLDCAERVEFRQMQVYELARSPQTYDLVLFMGVFYHLRYPLLALDIVADRTERLLAFQSMTMGEESAEPPVEDVSLSDRSRLGAPGWPKLAFVERCLQGDPTNWWVPNHACVEAMLHDVGFEVIGQPGHELYVCERSKQRTEQSWRNEAELDAALGHACHPLRQAQPGGPADGEPES